MVASTWQRYRLQQILSVGTNEIQAKAVFGAGLRLRHEVCDVQAQTCHGRTHVDAQGSGCTRLSEEVRKLDQEESTNLCEPYSEHSRGRYRGRFTTSLVARSVDDCQPRIRRCRTNELIGLRFVQCDRQSLSVVNGRTPARISIELQLFWESGQNSGVLNKVGSFVGTAVVVLRGAEAIIRHQGGLYDGSSCAGHRGRKSTAVMKESVAREQEMTCWRQ